MGIDGINKPGASVPPSNVGTVDATAGSASDFKDKLEGERTEPIAQVELNSALQQLDAGTLSVEEYLDLQVNQAVSHLQGALPAAELDFVRDSLRMQLSEDPVLVELVRRTTGSASR
jgi:hypothetical protein